MQSQEILETINSIIKKVNKLFIRDFDDCTRKLSHTVPNRTLLEHILICQNVGRRLLQLHFQQSFDGALMRFIDLLCLTHDLGKLSKDWDVYAKGKRISHSLVSMIITLENENFYSDKDSIFYFLPYFIRYHHSYLRVFERGLERRFLNSNSSLFARDFFDNVKEKYFNYLDSIKKILRRNVKNNNYSLNILLADLFGIFKTADILASKLSTNDIDSILKALERDWPSVSEFKSFLKSLVLSKGLSFNSEKFDKQLGLSTLDSEILVAPTGWGKTAYSIIKILKVRPIRVFYILPTITAIKMFSDRLKAFLGDETIGEYFYFADVDILSKNEGLINVSPEEVNLIYDINKFFLRKINITTIDQFLSSMLLLGKYFLRRYGFRRSLIIIDEFHLLNPTMIQLLLWIIRTYFPLYRFKILFMSATPDPAYVDILNELGSTGNFSIEIRFLADEYKKLSRHVVSYERGNMVDKLTGDFLDIITKKRTLIIANKVDTAINIYQALKNTPELKDKKIVLIHSRFTYFDRIEKEKLIPRTDILVSTQVAEVSLDVSYDVLFTELAPLSALIQRFGRVNRYGKSPTINPNVYIFDSDDHRPYTVEEIDISRRFIKEFVDAINNSGELGLINFYLSNIDLKELSLRALENAERSIKNNIIDVVMNSRRLFYSVPMDDLDVLRQWRDNYNILVIPERFQSIILRLYNDLLKTSNFNIRRKLLSEIKGYLVAVPYYLLHGKYYFYNKIPFPFVSRNYFSYSNDLGLTRNSL